MSQPAVIKPRYYSKTQRVAGAITWTDQDIMQVPFFLRGQLTSTNFAAFKVPGRDMYLQGYTLTLQQQNPAGASFSVNLLNGNGQPMAGGAVPDPTLLQVNGLQVSSNVQFAPFIPLPSGSYWMAAVAVPQASTGLTGSDLTLTYYFSYSNSPLINAQSIYAVAGEGIGFWTVGQNFIVATP